LSQPGSEISEITEENLVQEMKQAESGFLIAPSEIFFEFRQVDQTRRMGETMAPDGESGNCERAWRTAEENSWIVCSKSVRSLMRGLMTIS